MDIESVLPPIPPKNEIKNEIIVYKKKCFNRLIQLIVIVLLLFFVMSFIVLIIYRVYIDFIETST